ncbi:hypothetical protein CY34DRAFT_16043 [Suillus luteus UH-Slu-Lm8-n1]|uniref:Uncharacterized protein n=1 Tax=Suillus luteus UH-Slu-Lm8-n1 TaxID=930992 RepID=A0A0C9ZHR4_9AGAM|nr:hypothetical protein CY34DRAFT_16043 [Suillus luteus UH-Slu-Lm8-n1]
MPPSSNKFAFNVTNYRPVPIFHLKVSHKWSAPPASRLIPREVAGVSMNSHHNFLTACGGHPRSSASALFARLASLLHCFEPDNADANKPSQPLTLSGLHLPVLFARI